MLWAAVTAHVLILATADFVAAEPVCAEVKIEIQQELTLERQAFDARMRINNGLDAAAIEDVAIQVNFTDENGNGVVASSDPNSTTAKFFIRMDSIEGLLGSATRGADITAGRVAARTSAEIHWLIIPTPGAGGDQPSGKLYYVGASLDYTLGGQPEHVEVTPDFITVRPLPLLTLDYFMTRDVMADDPFTTPIEPAEPFTLGVRIRNHGHATAARVQIESAQPRITENQQGLLIDFRIVGSSVQDQPVSPSLLIPFGDIPAGSAKVGRWLMETTLSGTFVEFDARFSHADELGGALTSILAATNPHFLIHDVLVDLPGRDGVRDFLGYPAASTPGAIKRVYESHGVDTEVPDQSLASSFSLVSQTGTEVVHRLTTPVAAGFVYVQKPDPYAGDKVIKRVIRSDGKTIALDNAWLSKTRDRNTNTWQYWINFFDAGTSGSYTVHMGQEELGPVPPVLQFIANQTTFETNPVGFLVQASDPNGTIPALSAAPLPVGASLVDQGNGTAIFSFTPQLGQAGQYTIRFTASDGVLTRSQLATIRVNPIWDIDGDGMRDDWERQHFGNTNRDGRGDFDGDGISDLDEFLHGWDPTVPAPAAPASVTAVAGNTQVTLTWPAMAGATTYHVYWSQQPDLTKASGDKIAAVASGLVHTGLVNGRTYYYLVTAEGRGGESGASPIASATPGVWEWNTPVALEQEGGEASGAAVALGPDGQGMAVWAQSDGVRQNIWANSFASGSGWGVPVLLETGTGDATEAQVAMDSAGNAVAVWQQWDGTRWSIWAASFQPTLGWSAPALVDAASSQDAIVPQLAMSGDGRALVAWTQVGAESSLWSSRYDPAIGFDVPLPIEATTTLEVALAGLSLDGAGNALAVWTETAGGQTFDLLANRLTNAGWETAALLRTGITGAAAQGAVRPRLATDAAGNAVVVWAETSGIVSSIWADRFVAAAGWQGASLIELDDTGDAVDPAVAMNADGQAVAAWSQFDGVRHSIFATRFDPPAGWGAPALVETDSAADAAAPQVGVDDSGHAVLVWHQGDSLQQNIWANDTRPQAGAPAGWDRARIIETENLGDATEPQLAVHRGGNALAVWLQSDGAHVNLWANDYLPGNPGVPNIAPLAVAADLAVNEETLVSLDGAGSFDQDGQVVSYAWAQTSGTPVVLTGADTAIATLVAPTLIQPATLGFTLTVTDDAGASASTEVTVTVNPVNALPTADAGLDQTADENTLVTLSGHGTDSDGSIVKYLWTQTAGPLVALLPNPEGPVVTFTAPAVYEPTALGFQLQVTDNENGTAADAVAITVVSVNPDDDSDGMHDLWEIQYFGTLARDGTGDYDGDGATDAQEFAFGTDPTVPQGPGEPGIRDPDGTEVVTLQPTIIVDNAAHHAQFPATYRFEVYRDPGMTQLVASAVGVAEGTATTSWRLDVPLQDNTWHYYRVRADGWVLFSAWVESSFFVNTVNDPPGPFFISAPQDDVWVDTFTPTLSVTNSVDIDQDALTYAFAVYGDRAMTRLVASVQGAAPGSGGTTAWTVSVPLRENTWYTWQAVVTDEHGLATEGPRASFFVNTVNDAPSTPVLVSPADGSEIDTLATDLVVANAIDPEAEPLVYTFEIDTVNTFDSPAKQVSPPLAEGATTTAWTVTGLFDNTWHYWRAKASDGRAESPWAGGRFFANTVNDPPTTPAIDNPGDGSWVGTLVPTLSVHPATDLDQDVLRYEFEVFTARGYGQIGPRYTYGLSDTTFWQVAPALPAAGWHYWRARAVDEHGAVSPWSAAVIFYADDDGVNDPPEIRLKEIDRDDDDDDDDHNGRRPRTVRLQWHDRDPDSNADIRLYYATDYTGANSVLIADNIKEDPDGRYDKYTWDITALPTGIYTVYAVITDGTSTQTSFAPDVVIVVGGGWPFIELKNPDLDDDDSPRGRVMIRWKDRDPDSNAQISLYYDNDPTGADGTLIVAGLAEDPDGRHDQYAWDITGLPDGTYYLYAIIRDAERQFITYARQPIILPTSREEDEDNGRPGNDRRSHD